MALRQLPVFELAGRRSTARLGPSCLTAYQLEDYGCKTCSAACRDAWQGFGQAGRSDQAMTGMISAITA